MASKLIKNLKMAGNILLFVGFGLFLYYSCKATIEDSKKKDADLRKRMVAYNQLYLNPGYADKDKNGKLDLTERAELAKRAGVEECVVVSNSLTDFPYLNTNQLERAVASYEADLSRK